MAVGSGTSDPREGASVRSGVLLALPPLILAAVVFGPITQNYFFADDLLHLYEIAQWPAVRFVLEPFAGHVLIVPNTVFWTLGKVVGPHPATYFWLMLATHLVNVALLYRLIRAALSSDLLACFGAGLWGACPSHDGTLGWFSVYGQVVATTFVLLALAEAVRPGPMSTRGGLAWAILLLLAASSFGTAIAAALVSPLVLWLLRPAAFSRASTRVLVLLVPVLVVVGYVVLVALSAHRRIGQADAPSGVGLYSAFAHGVDPLATMASHLLGAGLSRLCFGFAYRFASYPSVAAVVLGVVVAEAVVLICIRGSSLEQRHILAMLLLASASYAVIAVGRAEFFLALRGTLDRAASAARYHYLGAATLTVMLCVVVSSFGDRVRVPGRARTALLGAWLAAMVVLYATSPIRIDHHPEARNEVERALAAIRGYVAAAAPGQPVTIENRRFNGIPWPRTYPGWAALFMIFFPTNEIDGHPVRFLNRDPITIEVVRNAGGRIATLLVEPTPRYRRRHRPGMAR